MIAPERRFFIRVCMDPRLFPGVRCSVLNTEYKSPSCMITMPGRNNVALMLLISSWRPRNQPLTPIQNELLFANSRRQPEGATRGITEAHWENRLPSAKCQYRLHLTPGQSGRGINLILLYPLSFAPSAIIFSTSSGLLGNRALRISYALSVISTSSVLRPTSPSQVFFSAKRKSLVPLRNHRASRSCLPVAAGSTRPFLRHVL